MGHPTFRCAPEWEPQLAALCVTPMEGTCGVNTGTESKRCSRCGLEYPTHTSTDCPHCEGLDDRQAKRYGDKVRDLRVEVNRPLAFLFFLLALLSLGIFLYATNYT